ncbi:MAG: sulfite exporter TauE/SafE family protein [Candidatus Kerfeldbacteria bacterium]|nr:sulfite exporter TauE/SafE family protein [Candidatus Kerfeldbacteria bacterium]
MLILILVGFVVGLLIGMTSMGGGAMMTPILITFLHYDPVVAVGSDIIYAAITKVVGSAVHIKQKTVDSQLVRRLAYGSVPGAIVGSLLAEYINHATPIASEYFKLAIGIAICSSATTLFISIFFDIRRLKQRLHDWLGVEQHKAAYTVLTGAIGGFLVGLTSVGAGSIMLVMMLVIYNTSTRKLIGSDIVHATILLFTAGLLHLFAGNVNWTLTLSLLIGSIPGVLIGSRFVQYVPRTFLKATLVLLLLFLGSQLIYKFFF